MRVMLSILTICAVSVFLNACNTIGGAGQDIKAGGQAISNTATKVKSEI